MSLDIIKVTNGIYDVFVIKNDQYIGPRIANGYEWDGWMRNDIVEHYKEDTDIIDIGANIGYNTLMFSDYGPVVSFEPVYHQIVNHNCKANKLKNKVSVFPCALSNEIKQTEIYLPSHHVCRSNTHLNYGGTSFDHTGDARGLSVDVHCDTLDNIYKGTPSVIKIDVEGHELQVLEGAKETIKKHMPTILIELHDFKESMEEHIFLKDLGYDDPIERPEVMFLYRAKENFSTM
jgi:FkbM family methyltransferase